MPLLQLTEEQARSIVELVDIRLRDLHREIAHTNRREYRERLRHEAILLEAIAGQLATLREAG